jgi:Rod binding domain-containing protein
MFTPQIKTPVAADTSAVIERNRMTAPDAEGDGDQHQQLINQTEKWVAQTFYGELLKQMRESPFRSDMFEGGNGGKTFETLLDQRLADHMSRHAGGKLVKAIVRKIEAGQAAKKYQQASRSGRADGIPRTVAAAPKVHEPRRWKGSHFGPKAHVPRKSNEQMEPPVAHIPSHSPRLPHQLHSAGHGMPQRHAGTFHIAHKPAAGKHF